MNLYLVVSETLYEHIFITDEGEGPDEPYSLCELVLAESREQARWLVWQSDKNSTGGVRDIPNFRTRKLDVLNIMLDAPEIVSDKKPYQHFWNYKKTAQLLSSLGSW